ncbi:MAG: YHS domain-containing protein [Fimbriimonadaceae bacterium]|nr:YHS domain-containing protein [Fimbriimonadaceae bacterium]
MITTLIAAMTLFAPAGADTPLACPIMGSPTNAKSQALDYNGARFRMCCGGCDGAFKKDAANVVGKLKADSKAIGEFLFDPTTGLPIDAKKAKATTDYNGIRYHFATEAGKDTFTKNAKTLAVMPKKEVMSCPVMGSHAVASYAKAGGYADHDGVRYYFCCADCVAKFRAEPAKYAKAASAKAKAPVVQDVK